MEFKYTGRSKQNQIQSGVIESPSKRDALASLQERGLIVLELVDTGSASVLSRQIVLFRRVKTKEIVVFSRQLATLFSARIPLLESLRTLGRQSENSYFKKVIFEIAGEVEGGSLFSDALAKHPKVFSSFFIQMIKSAEVSGGLDRSLAYLADYLEKQYYLNSKIRGAMIYPAFILCVFLIVGVVIMIVVMPQLTSFLTEASQELPLPTKILVWISSFLRSWGWLFLLVIIGSVFGITMLVNRSTTARYYYDLIKLKLPVFGKTYRGIYLSRITDNLSTLIQGGLPILQALQITGDVVGNVIYKDIINESRENVRIGNMMSASLEKHPEYIPSMVTQMIYTGEKSGSVDEILKKLSAFYTQEVDAMMNNLSQMIEPVLIVVLGLAVAWLVVSILVPIYNIVGSM